MPELDCEQARRLVHLQLDRELGEDEARVLEEHLEQCEDCARLRDELDLVAVALRQGLGAVRLPEPSVDAVRQRVRRARTGQVVWATWMPAAAAFVLVSMALLLGLPRTNGREPAHLAAPAVVVAGGDALHVFEPDQKTAQSGSIGTELQERAVAWGLGGNPIALDFAGGAHVELNDEAVVRIGRDAIDLFKGDLRADLTDARDAFTVVTPWGEFSGAGAVFTVYSNNDASSSRLTVLSGEVKVDRQGTVRTLSAGETVKLQPDPQRAITL